MKRHIVRLNALGRLRVLLHLMRMAIVMTFRPLPPGLREGDTYTMELRLSIHFDYDGTRLHA